MNRLVGSLAGPLAYSPELPHLGHVPHEHRCRKDRLERQDCKVVQKRVEAGEAAKERDLVRGSAKGSNPTSTACLFDRCRNGQKVGDAFPMKQSDVSNMKPTKAYHFPSITNSRFCSTFISSVIICHSGCSVLLPGRDDDPPSGPTTSSSSACAASVRIREAVRLSGGGVLTK